MKYVDEFRDGGAARRLLGRIRQSATRRWVLMEVCGGQTHSLLRHGIAQELSGRGRVDSWPRLSCLRDTLRGDRLCPGTGRAR